MNSVHNCANLNFFCMMTKSTDRDTLYTNVLSFALAHTCTFTKTFDSLKAIYYKTYGIKYKLTIYEAKQSAARKQEAKRRG